MSITVTLEYQRNAPSMTSRGRMLSNENGLVTEEGTFDDLSFKDMLKALVTVLRNWPVEDTPVDVVLQRTDRPGLVPYKLDERTVQLLRTDPVAGIEALSFQAASPSTTEQAINRAVSPPPAPTLKAGAATLADAFGDSVAVRVRGHELECPGCGFWGAFTTPGLLNDPERAGQVFKTIFSCPKKCRGRYFISCQKEWGFIPVEYLLEQTNLDRFYFPRAWNGGNAWVTRGALQRKYDEYKNEKENVR